MFSVSRCYLSDDAVREGGFSIIRLEPHPQLRCRHAPLEAYEKVFGFFIQEQPLTDEEAAFLLAFVISYPDDFQAWLSEPDVGLSAVPPDFIEVREDVVVEETLDNLVRRNASGRGERIRRRHFGF